MSNGKGIGIGVARGESTRGGREYGGGKLVRLLRERDRNII